MEFNLQLADDKVKPHQLTTLHLVSAFAFIGTGAIIAIYNYTIPGWGLAILALGLGILAVTIFRNKWTISPAINPIFRLVELAISAAFLVYAVHMDWKFPIVIFGGLCLALAFALYWERQAANKLFIHADDEGLQLPVLRRRNLQWNEVENVVFRYGILTINTLDNHLFQWSIDDTDAKPETFEQYCNQKISDNIAKRRNDDW